MPTPPTLIYDGDCRFCRACVRWLRRWSGVRFIALPSNEAVAPPEIAARFAVEVVLHEGDRWFGGAEAMARLLAVNPWWRGIALVYYLRGLRGVLDAGYRWVAARRGCVNGACAVTLAEDPPHPTPNAPEGVV